MNRFYTICIPARLLAIAGVTLLPRSVAIIIAMVLIAILAYKYHTYQPGQLATFDKTLVVKWNNLRLMHIFTLLMYIALLSFNHPQWATGMLLANTSLSLLING